MAVSTFHWLKEIRNQHRREFGKGCQLLVAISFCRIGFNRVSVQLVQGVDLELDIHSTFPKFALEVKTTQNDRVLVAKKDVEGLAAKANDGYEIGLAVLRLGLLSDWVIAKANHLSAGTIPIGRLETRAVVELQRELNQQFPQVLAQYAAEILKAQRGEVQEYLQSRLAIEQSRQRKLAK
jgi:hypothetical protein